MEMLSTVVLEMLKLIPMFVILLIWLWQSNKKTKTGCVVSIFVIIIYDIFGTWMILNNAGDDKLSDTASWIALIQFVCLGMIYWSIDSLKQASRIRKQMEEIEDKEKVKLTVINCSQKAQ